jgi:hypothetical protein
MLESLATCPVRTLAERAGHLDVSDDSSRVLKSIGTILHGVLETIYRPLLDVPNLPAAFAAHYGFANTEIGRLEGLVSACWAERQKDWLATEKRLSQDQKKQALQSAKTLLPNLASYIKNDLAEAHPHVSELALLYPNEVELHTKSNSSHALKDGWRRTLRGVEHKLGPIELPIAQGQTVTVAGVVDRIELWENNAKELSFFRITDYKASSKSRLEAYAKSDAPFAGHLQTPLYVWMAMEIHGGPATSVLIPLREENPKPFAKHMLSLAEHGLSGIGWQDRLGNALARLHARVKEGDSPPTPGDHCQYCGYSALCMRPVDIHACEIEGEGE